MSRLRTKRGPHRIVIPGRGRRRHRRRRQPVPATLVLPTLMTLGNLLCGFAAIHFATRPADWVGLPWNWTGLMAAAVLIFAGMFLDALDGSVARLTRSASTLGAQLDSLADMVTFGVAPAFMGLRLVIAHLEGAAPGVFIIGPDADGVLGKAVWGIAAVYVCCAGLRLARFSVETGLSSIIEYRLFRGLPSPGAAGAVASLVLLHQHLLVTKFPPPDVPLAFVQWSTLVIPLVMLLCSLAMVSRIPYVHIVNEYLREPRSFGFIVRVALVLAFAIWWFQETLAVALVAYAISGPGAIAWKHLRRRYA